MHSLAYYYSRTRSAASLRSLAYITTAEHVLLPHCISHILMDNTYRIPHISHIHFVPLLKHNRTHSAASLHSITHYYSRTCSAAALHSIAHTTTEHVLPPPCCQYHLTKTHSYDILHISHIYHTHHISHISQTHMYVIYVMCDFFF